MKTIHFFFILLTTTPLLAQENLIPNPSFEEYYDCDYDVITTPLQEVIPHWSFRASSPRYFHVDCIDELVVAPLFDKAYVACRQNVTSAEDSGFALREYPQVKLLSPIEAGKTYFLSYYITLPFSNDSKISHYGIYFDDELWFGENPWGSDSYPILLDPQIEIDTLVDLEIGRWQKMTHCFVADATYDVMVAGVFAHNAEILGTENILINNTGIAYDNFFLAEIDPVVAITIESADTICVGDCVTITSNHSLIEGDFVWDLPGSNIGSSIDSVVTVCYDLAGTYDIGIDVTHCDGAYANFFPQAITVLDAVEHQPAWADTTVCVGETLWIDLSDTEYSVLWEDGSTASSRILDEAGSYTYTLSNGFCFNEYSLNVQHTVATTQFIDAQTCTGEAFDYLDHSYTQVGTYWDTLRNAQFCDSIIYEIFYHHFEDTPIEIEGILGLCAGDESEVQVVSPHQEVFWTDPQNNIYSGNSFILQEVGTHSLWGLDAYGCVYEDTFYTTVYPVPQVMTEDLLDTVFQGNLTLPVSYSGNIEVYEWTVSEALDCTNCPFPQLVQAQAGVYTIYVENEYGCSDQDQIVVHFAQNSFYVPNAISKTPNISTNGVLFLQSNTDIRYSLAVYDRWGNLLYKATDLQTNNEQQGWHPQDTVNPSVFVYVIQFDNDGKSTVLAGDVTVLE